MCGGSDVRTEMSHAAFWWTLNSWRWECAGCEERYRRMKADARGTPTSKIRVPQNLTMFWAFRKLQGESKKLSPTVYSSSTSTRLLTLNLIVWSPRLVGRCRVMGGVPASSYRVPRHNPAYFSGHGNTAACIATPRTAKHQSIITEPAVYLVVLNNASATSPTFLQSAFPNVCLLQACHHAQANLVLRPPRPLFRV